MVSACSSAWPWFRWTTGQGVLPGCIDRDKTLGVWMWVLLCCLPSRPDSEPWPMLFASPDKAIETTAHGWDLLEKWRLWVTLQCQHSITSSTEREAAIFPACCRFWGGNFGSWHTEGCECWCEESYVPSSGGPPWCLSQNDSYPLLSLSESLPQSISGLCFGKSGLMRMYKRGHSWYQGVHTKMFSITRLVQGYTWWHFFNHCLEAGWGKSPALPGFTDPKELEWAWDCQQVVELFQDPGAPSVKSGHLA